MTPSPPHAPPAPPALPLPRLVALFAAFAFAYFLSALVRAITATLSPTLSHELALQARDLGLLSGGYFLGFAITQLPLGQWLDRHGPKRVILCFLVLAVAGALLFARATSFSGLLWARVLTGAGLSACLMAPLTGYRRWFSPRAQMRVNSWMLMTGSLGMLASTLPVQWLLPLVGWRAVFVGLAGLVLLAMALIALWVPTWDRSPQKSAQNPATGPANSQNSAPDLVASGFPSSPAVERGYRPVWRNRYFWSLVPMGFFSYGGLVAMQTLWAGPWMVRVAGFTPQQAALGLFAVNISMLAVFWAWGLLTPQLTARGWPANRLMAWGAPLPLLAMALVIATANGPLAVAGPVWVVGAWVLFCVCSSVTTLSQPAVALAFRPELAGRALSAYNLVVFIGVFTVQWAIGLIVDALSGGGFSVAQAFQWAMGLFTAVCAASYVWFVRRERPFAAR